MKKERTNERILNLREQNVNRYISCKSVEEKRLIFEPIANVKLIR